MIAQTVNHNKNGCSSTWVFGWLSSNFSILSFNYSRKVSMTSGFIIHLIHAPQIIIIQIINSLIATHSYLFRFCGWICDQEKSKGKLFVIWFEILCKHSHTCFIFINFAISYRLSSNKMHMQMNIAFCTFTLHLRFMAEFELGAWHKYKGIFCALCIP